MVASIFECGQTVNIEGHARHEASPVAHAAFSGLSGSSGATFGSGVAPEGPCDPFSLRGCVLPPNGSTSGTKEELSPGNRPLQAPRTPRARARAGARVARPTWWCGLHKIVANVLLA